MLKNKELEERIERLEVNNNMVFEKNDKNVTYSAASSNKKNSDKYIFNEMKFPKNRLVLEVIKNFVSLNPNISYQQLKSAFPDHLIDKPYGVFEKLDIAKHNYPNEYERRYFTKDNEIILIDSGYICVCTQWEQKYIGRFLNQCKKHGFEIEIV